MDRIPGFIVLNPHFDVEGLKKFAEKNWRKIKDNSEKVSQTVIQFLENQLELEKFEKHFCEMVGVREIVYS